MNLKGLLVFTFGTWTFVGIVMLYHGVFLKLTVDIQEHGPYYFVYTEQRGTVDQSLKTLENLKENLKKQGVLTTKSMVISSIANLSDLYGLFSRKKQGLPHSIGWLLSADDFKRLSEDNDDLNYLLIPKQPFVHASLPFRSVLSFLLSILKVYPAIYQFMDSHRIYTSTRIEIYDDPEQSVDPYITYLIPLHSE